MKTNSASVSLVSSPGALGFRSSFRWRRPISLSFHLHRVLLLCLLVLPVAGRSQCQLTYTTNGGVVAITGHSGPCTTVNILSTINGLPVTSIGDRAFAQDPTLTALVIPDSVTSIGDFAFSYCTNLTNVALGNGVADLGFHAFEGCNLTRINLPNSLTSLPAYAFYDCANLTEVTVGTNVTRVESHTFGQCVKLTHVFFRGNAPGISKIAFDPDTTAVAYYLPGTVGWEYPLPGPATALWNPQVRTDATLGIRTNRVGFTITGTANIPLVVEATTNLATGTWVALQALTLSNGSSYFSDAQWTNYRGRFYRIRSP